MKQIIMISGLQGAGKTTVANELCRISGENGFDFVGIEKFAEPIYKLHNHILNMIEYFTGIPRKSKDGELLQIIGDYGKKVAGVDIWANILRKNIDNNKYTDWSKEVPRFRSKDKYTGMRLVIIDDLRFKNEFHKFDEALRVRLVCSEEIRKKRCSNWRENTQHNSEIDLDKYDYKGYFDLYLDTDGDNLEHCVNLIMAKLKKNSWIERRKSIELNAELANIG